MMNSSNEIVIIFTRTTGSSHKQESIYWMFLRISEK